jgi:iron complex outermembrane receptor protein
MRVALHVRRMSTERKRTASGVAAWLALAAAGAQAQTPPAPATPPTAPQEVVVTATRTEAAPFDVPASIDRIDGDAVRTDRAQVNISESLAGVPGLTARDRQNYAQDVQISVRGFGARSSFGLRGVRVYVDGIPATFPDGQGQITNVDLGSVDHIEVLRGPGSALYGNAAGGVIQVFTEDGVGAPTLDVGAAFGSDGERRENAKLSGSAGALGYVLSGSSFRTDGYRDHSAARRDIANGKLSWHDADAGTFTLIANSVELPEAQDPLGLTRALYDADPRGVDPAALAFNTRKTIDQSQFGLVWERGVGRVGALHVIVYGGHRNTEQFQSITLAAQANPLNPGGVIALGSDYSGADARYTLKAPLAGRPFTLVAGLAADKLDQHRLGYQNFTGSGASAVDGVQGALRRDENDLAIDLDPYLQASWQLARDWSLSAGARRSRVRISSTDHDITAANGDDSGGARYATTLPVAGLMWAVSDQVHVYANAGRGFETPTLNELAYRPDGRTGLNFGLKPATSDTFELGLKTRLGGLGELTAAVFDTRTHDEIVTYNNTGGRSTYQNVGDTRRKGFELGWRQHWLTDLHGQLALDTLDARYRNSFESCNLSPCPTASEQLVAAGNRLPGVARASLDTSLSWTPPQGWRGGVDARYLSRVFVNDINSDAAPSYVVASANVGYAAVVGAWTLGGFARSDNLFARHYAGSVIVNEGNGRYFEPAPGRTWLGGMNATLAF